ncbi:WD40-repeat-containing domain protein [Suillus bovinus]|uniref:WD40-repeat-containing domain protein n=1 Tax=Suillus bovinus TaxID=48563 RepID=UPI001B8661DB|nr:WD40-repeat-containing domain protein [Suillus bovinus]KAG2132828.1 WD40-repeat-containing domain protein [Suillus bovinus]
MISLCSPARFTRAFRPKRPLRLLAAAIHKKVYIYEITSTSSAPLTCLDAHTNNVTSVSFHSEGRWLVTGSEDGTIRIWDLRSTQVHRTYDNVNDVCVHPNQGELISCDQAGCIKQWDLSENLCSHELVCSEQGCSGRLAGDARGDIPIRSVSLGKRYVWKINEEKSDLPRYQAVTKFTAHEKYLTRVLLSPDVIYLATCSADTTVKIWSISQNYEFRQEKVLQGHQCWACDCAFSANSTYLVTAAVNFPNQMKTKEKNSPRGGWLCVT